MVPLPPKSRLFEEHEIPTEGVDRLHAKMMLPKPPVLPKRLVIVPPLIGAGASQALVIYRNITRRGSILLSFEYRGHRGSTGTFELDKTIVDTRYAMRWASAYAQEHGLPLHAFAMCYGVVALLAQFADGKTPCPLWSLSTVSGLFRLDQIIRFENFAFHLGKHLGRELDKETMLAMVESGELDCEGEPFRCGLHDFLKALFPELRVGHDYFEELEYHRVAMRNLLLQLSRARYFDNVRVPSELPCHVVYGRGDDIMGTHTPEGIAAYRDRALGLMPQSIFHEWDVDHFGQGPDRAALIDRLADIFEESESRAVSLEMEKPADTLQDSRS